MKPTEFSFRSRSRALERFRSEEFDLLIIGGGITGAGVARDAISRGLSVALVEKEDFAYGTSSRSSKLIHGGLRYLENLEFGLVFESLAERAHLLKTVPHMVKPLPFFLPSYRGDRNGKNLLDLGLWLYDLLALFRTPGFHQRLSQKRMLEQIPFLKSEGLLGGFRYFDASMWDDVLAVETLRGAHAGGAAIANYVEAVGPLWKGERISGFRVRDREKPPGQGEIDLHARQVVICAGPWTDLLGPKLGPQWKSWLQPSKGVHLIFDLKRLPVPGAVTMSHPEDGRIAFVIPRPDFGPGVVIVGTTDGPSPVDPSKAGIDSEDVRYLLTLLNRYFPSLHLGKEDILSGYVGVRPLVSPTAGQMEGGAPTELRKVSREHHIDRAPGGAVVVAGGKYTTYRRMAEEIVDFALANWKHDAREGRVVAVPSGLLKSSTKAPVNPAATIESLAAMEVEAGKKGLVVPADLVKRYGGEALTVMELHQASTASAEDPAGFPFLEAQLRHAIRQSMVLHLQDFFFRRIALYASRKDHGLPWVSRLAQIWAEERGLSSFEAQREADDCAAEIRRRSQWLEDLAYGESPRAGADAAPVAAESAQKS